MSGEHAHPEYPSATTVNEFVDGTTSRLSSFETRLAAVEAKLEQPATPPPSPTPPAPVVIPAGYGKLLRKDFSDGLLAPFKRLVYPDDHIGQSGQYMTTYTRYRDDPATVSVHDGYLDLHANRRPDGLWNGACVGTGRDGYGDKTMLTFGPGVIVRWYARMNIGHATWQALWLYNVSWGSPEIDFYELLESGPRLTTLGSSKNGTTKLPAVDTDWHEIACVYAPDYVATLIDGTEVGRIAAKVPGPMALLADVAIGFGWDSNGKPDATTPDPTYLHIAGVTVDPLP
jgi:hypothetical protein